MPPLTPWYLTLFGGLRANRGEQTITRFRSQKFGTLLAFLAMNPDRLHTREELLDLLWPDADLDSGRTNLRSALSWLRRQFEGPEEEGRFLVTQGNTHVRLNPASFTTDVVAFERQIRLAGQSGITLEEKRIALEQAISLYSGPLLSGIYDSWALNERERLADRFQIAVQSLADFFSSQGNYGVALDYARRGLQADSLREETNILIVRLLARSGETAAARRHYDEYARSLDEQLGLQPVTPLSVLLEVPSLTVPAAKIPIPPPLAPAPQRSPLKKLTQPGALPPSLPENTESTVSTPSPQRPRIPTTPPPRWLPLNRFLGRDVELNQVLKALETTSTRLLTITGPGGSGKTRLSQEGARHLMDHYPGGVWFVPLADARSAPDLAAVATTLNLPPAPTLLPSQQVVSALNERSGRTLLILDNLEQIVEEAAAFVGELLEGVAELSILATSRIRLGIEGERELPLMPLPLPNADTLPGELEVNPSAALFVERARSVRSDFALTERNAPAVARICNRLDGMPLALELAAAWVQTLTPAQIADRLQSRFDLLVSRKRGVPERHATLRSAIDWSYRLLSRDQQEFFARLSVFRGGWTLEAAEEVCSEPDALEMLAELQERSLISAVESGDAMRYRMLETLREFAEDQLPKEEVDVYTRRHTEYFLKFATFAYPKLWGAESVHYLNWLEADHDNFRAAVEACLSRPDGAFPALELCRNLYPFWDVRGYAFEGRRYLTSALAMPDIGIPCETRAGALYAVASFALLHSELSEAETMFRECFELMRTQGNQENIIDTLCRLGLVQHYRGNVDGAETLFREGLALIAPLNNPGSEAHLLKCLGAVLREKGQWEEAERCYNDALRLYRSLGAEHGIAMMLGELAALAQTRGQFALAESFTIEQWKIAQETGSISMQSYALQSSGATAMLQQQWSVAMDSLRESLSRRKQIGERSGAAYLAFLLGYCAWKINDVESGRRYLTESFTDSRSLSDQKLIGANIQLAGALAVSLQRLPDAARLFGFAETVFGPDLASATSELTPFDGCQTSLLDTLGAMEFAHHFEEGRQLSFAEGVRLVQSV